jgi:hypothetical protein
MQVVEATAIDAAIRDLFDLPERLDTMALLG